RGVVLQLPGDLSLLGLSTAASHGPTPSHMNVGAARRRAPMTSGISRGSYGTQVLASSAPRAPLHVAVAYPNCRNFDGKGVGAESVVPPGTPGTERAGR